MKKAIILFIIVILSTAFLYKIKDYNEPKISQAGSSLSAAFFSMGIEVKDLVKKYSSKKKQSKIKILIVAGHEPDFGGAEYGSLKERDLNLQLAEKLKAQLDKNKKFDVTLARDSDGWNSDLENYVRGNVIEIDKWVNSMRQEMHSLILQGKIKSETIKVGHANAPTSSRIFLYGINKWTSLNKTDIVIHIHFNDNPRYKGKPSYNGFSIYVPESQYSNSTSSKILAEDLMKELLGIHSVSNLPGESIGVIEDQELIALGSYNTSDSLSVLVEYAYIYEPLMQNSISRNQYIEKSALSTAKAIEYFFESRK